MKNIKIINVENGPVIIDGFSKLLVISPALIEEMPMKSIPECRNLPCSVKEFTTKKGRQALSIVKGNSHLLSLYNGCGDISHNDWINRCPVNAMFAEERTTSNGGGCWYEVIIMKVGDKPISSEAAEYLDEHRAGSPERRAF